MQSEKMAAIAMTTLLVELIFRAQADTSTQLDGLGIDLRGNTNTTMVLDGMPISLQEDADTFTLLDALQMNGQACATAGFTTKAMRRWQEKKKRFSVHPLNIQRDSKGASITLYANLREDEIKFFNYFRMSPKTFDELFGKVESQFHITRTHSMPISPMERLCVTLRSICGENGTLYPSKFGPPKKYWSKGPCSCDPVCAHYKDCCRSSEYFVAEDQLWGSSPPTCLMSKSGVYYNMKKSCPHDWDEDETRSKCHEDTGFPLTSDRTHVSYSNMYCAQCNGDFDPNADSLWPVAYTCYNNLSSGYRIEITSGTNDTTDVNITVLNEDVDHDDIFHYRYPVNSFDFVHSYFVPEALAVYDPRSKPNFIRSEQEYPTTQLNADGGNYECEMSFVLDLSIMRLCSQYISTCASDWTDGDVEELCLAYTDIYCDNMDRYRNPHCALCNHVNLSQTFFCRLGTHKYKSGFSRLLNWNIRESEMPPLQNDTSVDVEDVQQGDPALRYVTIVGLCLSVGCLALHLAIFTATPQLRNLPAMNLASLCVALLVLYCSFLVRMAVDEESCVALAVAIYYGMLATFCWMLVISFDVWKAIRRSTKKLQFSSGMKWKRFSGYSAFGWVTPVLIIASLFSLNTNYFNPGDHLRHCWFSQARHILVFVVTPLCIVMTLNAVFFSWSACLVYSTKSKMENRSTAKTHLCLFVRLAVIMGLTWITGLIAGVLNLAVMWYVFVLLNTLQGVFIFVSFSCTKKIWRELRRKRALSSQTTTSTTATSPI